MLRITNKLTTTTTLLLRSKAYFSQPIELNRRTSPVLQRVTSTPTWPVPYYQRLVKAYPIYASKNVDLIGGDSPPSDKDWISAKKILNNTPAGRQIVHNMENNVQTNTFLLKKEDCESIVKAYVEDMSQFLNLANKEHVRILKGKALI